MSFHICVELPHDRIPKPDDPSETIPWLAEWTRHTLYEAPLGIDAVIYQYWSLPAGRLGLRLLGGLYNHGLHVQGRGLAGLWAEADTLEAFWDEHPLEEPAPVIDHFTLEALLEYLHAAMGCLREAIDIAEVNGATLTVS